MKHLSLMFLLIIVAASAYAEDKRQYVKLPEMMQNHMLGNMRDHLATFAEMNALIANQQWDKAADVIEKRIGMSSLGSHGAEHMAKFMPKPMRQIGTEMHRAASRLALTIQTEETTKIFQGVAEVMTRCNACHIKYRVK